MANCINIQVASVVLVSLILFIAATMSGSMASGSCKCTPGCLHHSNNCETGYSPSCVSAKSGFCLAGKCLCLPTSPRESTAYHTTDSDNDLIESFYDIAM